MTAATDSMAPGDRENALDAVHAAFALARLAVPEADVARAARTLARLGTQARQLAAEVPTLDRQGDHHGR